ncbi:ATP-grasp domain-containing protein [Vagococcus xieshaowenii]|nr:ATP-grasp domain-containing protein [Vagococcus xieshaowenii]
MGKLLIPGQTIGIIGGGNISRMLCLSAKKLGMKVGIIDHNPNNLASDVADWQIVGEVDDTNKLVEFANKSDVVLYENENIKLSDLLALSEVTLLPQGKLLIELSKNRVKEREFLENCNLNIAPYRVAHMMVDIYDAVEYLGYPCVIKLAENKPNAQNIMVIERMEDLSGCAELINQGPCIVESLIPKTKEISVMVANNGVDKPVFFPISEKARIHKKLEGSIGPVHLSDEMEQEIYRVAEILTLTLRVQGLLTIEMFINDMGIIYVNTISGVPTSDGYFTEYHGTLSQTDALIRAICGWPISIESRNDKWLTIEVDKEHYSNLIGQLPYQKNWQVQIFGSNVQSVVNRSTGVGLVAIPVDNLSEAYSDAIGSQIWSD